MLSVSHLSPIDEEPLAAYGRPPRFTLLGDLEVWIDGRPVEIRGTIQRTLLATLLAANSRTVSVHALVDELWGENPPATADNSLQAHISRLRRKLHGAGNTRSVCLLSLPAGYRLLVQDGDVDALVFHRTVTSIRAAATVIDPVLAVEQLHAALALWRGSVFGGLTGGPICQAAAARYLEDRQIALETLFDLELRRGRHCEVIAELSGLMESVSLNERTCEQLMIALYRSGRQTEALETFRRMRTRLDDELGVQPSPPLRQIETAILNHHPALCAGGDHTALRA